MFASVRAALAPAASDPVSAACLPTRLRFPRGRAAPPAWVTISPDLSVLARGAPLEAAATTETALVADRHFPEWENIIPYFEVTVSDMLPSTAIAVGFCDSKFPKSGALPGWRLNSFGFHSDDGRAFYACATEGTDFGPTWGRPGDVVGCGIDTAGRVFYSLNGKFLGVAPACVGGQAVSISTVGMFPVVGFDGDCSFAFNFGASQFRFNVLAHAVVPIHELTANIPVRGEESALVRLPLDLQRKILHTAVSDPADARSVSLVCRQFYSLVCGTSANDLWRRLAHARWVHMPDSLDATVVDWHRFFEKRHVSVRQARGERNRRGYRPDTDYPIENCLEWEFKCPIAEERLSKLDEKTDFCSACQESVHLAVNTEELVSHVKAGHCVVWDEQGALTAGRKVPVRMMRGKVRMPSKR